MAYLTQLLIWPFSRLDFSRVHLSLDEVTLITKDLVDCQRSFHNDANQRLEKLTEEIAQVQLFSESQSQTQRAVQTLCHEILTVNRSANGPTYICRGNAHGHFHCAKSNEPDFPDPRGEEHTINPDQRLQLCPHPDFELLGQALPCWLLLYLP
jgi:hypothetical protein